MECLSCSSEETTPTSVAHDVRIGDRLVAGRVPAEKCTGCGEVFIGADDLDLFELEVAETILRVGVVDGGTFRFLRQTMHLTAKQLAPMLAVTAEKIAGWEKAVLPVERSAWLALALMVADKKDGRARAKAIVDAAARPGGELPDTITMA